MAETYLPPIISKKLQGMLQNVSFAFVISDCSKPDMPIVFASSHFYLMTGYQADEVIGKNCRFLQGPETERRKVMEIRDAIREDRCCQVCLTNYRKDGSKFLNQFFLSPIKDDQGIVQQYVGIQTDVTAAADSIQQPQALPEQQAAVILGKAAGCDMCDVLMQQQQVEQQIQKLQQQPDQQPDQQQQRQEQQQHSKQQQNLEAEQQSDEVPSDEHYDIVQEEVRQASTITDIIQQSAVHADSHLPASLLQPLMKLQQSFVLADPRLPDCPIVHVSDSFLELTGYSREEVLGRNCRFLQGPDTDQTEVQKLRGALSATPPQPVTVVLLNYTKQGRPFHNALHIAPVRDADGRVEYFIGIQLDVSETGDDGSTHAPAKLHLSHKLAHYSVTGAVRVACRGLSGSQGGLRRSLDCQGLPKRGYSRRLSGDGSLSNGWSTSKRTNSWAPGAASGQGLVAAHAATEAGTAPHHAASAPSEI